MKPGLLVLTLFMFALVAFPVVPDARGSEDQVPPASVTLGYEYRGNQGHGIVAMQGMMRGTGPGPRAGPGPNPPGGRNGRELPAGAVVREELRRDPVDIESPVRIFRLRGYRRLSGKNVLNHEKRHLIYSTILLNPGIDLVSLADLTGINLNTMRYHIGHLLRNRKVTCIEHNGRYHFFEKHGCYDLTDQHQVLFRESPTSGRIITLVRENPGISRGEIAGHLEIAGPSVTRWMQRLVSEGMVTEERDGRFARYYPVYVPCKTDTEPGSSHVLHEQDVNP